MFSYLRMLCNIEVTSLDPSLGPVEPALNKTTTRARSSDKLMGILHGLAGIAITDPEISLKNV